MERVSGEIFLFLIILITSVTFFNDGIYLVEISSCLYWMAMCIASTEDWQIM